MAERDDTKLLGLRGLYVEAQRRKDAVAARAYAEEAAKAAPALGWAGQAVLEFRCAAGDWAARALGARPQQPLRPDRQGRIPRQRAVLLTARALAAEDGDRDRARSLALDARQARADAGAGRRAGRAAARRSRRTAPRQPHHREGLAANPHPDLADTYAHLRPGDSARERLARVQSLAQKAPGHAESALAVARAALDAQEFAVAREALKPLLKEPTQRVAELMAEIEQRESGDEGRAREWMARALRAPRDPAWTADGFVSDRWMPVSPVSGRLDAFQWKVPLAELGDDTRRDRRRRLGSAPRQPPTIVTPLPELPPRVDARSAATPNRIPRRVRPRPLAGSAPKPPQDRRRGSTR